MVTHRLQEARKSWGRLIGKLVARGWQDRATRLVLFDAYVRSILLYGCSVWGAQFVRPATGELVVGPYDELGIFYRRCLRSLLGVGPRTRSEVVYALTGRFPVEVHLRKALCRYTRSLADHPRRATDMFKWAQAVELGEGTADDIRRYRGKTSFGRLHHFAVHLEGTDRDERGICARVV